MGRPKVNLQLTSIIKGKYIACRKLGEGGCGVIYEVALIESPHRRFAFKAEDSDSGHEEEILKVEEKVMRKINKNNAIHCPVWIESGKFDNYNFMVMSLLGPSLSDLRKVIPTQVGLFLFSFVHRDVKPSNYAIGLPGTPKEKLVYVLDFGLARSFKTESGVFIRKPILFRGTTRYCSVNAHSREEQGRQDDLWSLFYMLVEMLIGSLPWKNMTDHGPTEREKTLKEADLLEQCPKEFELYVVHLKQLTYAIAPGTIVVL
uniref:Protein kinase domain-containing protein n=1 Tax=Angiostrongylus cantonensis TaxID=6313 RepID=A0A0K0DDU8_ANGCA